jgi:UDP-N-acetylmuramate--alanine ligase
MDQAVDAVVKEAEPGDLILTLGAGNVWQAGDRVLERLREGA